MNCKLALPHPKSSLHVISPTSDQSTKTHLSDSISFASHVTKSRISIRNPTGPCRARLKASIEAFYAPTASIDSLYQVLGVEESRSTLSDIKKAYKKMARKYHPDVAPPDRVDEHTRRFIMVKEAYDTLSNPQRKALYDRNLDNGHDQRMEEKEWKIRWQSQLDELKRRNKSSSTVGRMSWGARMRTRT